MSENGALSRNAVITGGEGGGSFEPLPAGVYPFTVIGNDWQVSKGKKTAGCEQAALTLEVQGEDRKGRVFENIILTESLAWRIRAFFGSIGLAPKEGEFKMNWNEVPGSKGVVRLKIEKYMKDGEEKMTNRVDYFIHADDAAEALAKATANKAAEDDI